MASLQCTVKSSISYLDGFLIVLIQFFAISGNSLFFIGLFKFPSLRNPTNIFLGSLAFADITVALLPMGMTFAVFVCAWGPTSQQTDQNINTAYVIIDIWCGSSSILSLTVIAIDRYFAINWPFIHQRVVKPHRAFAVVMIVWIIAALNSTLRLIKALPKKYVTLTSILVSFGAPLVIMSFCYVNIAIIARRQAIRIAQLNAAGHAMQRRYDREAETTNAELTVPNETSTSGEKSGEAVDANHNGEPEKKLPNVERHSSLTKSMSTIRRGTVAAVTRVKAVGRELKAAKNLGIVMGTFLIAWTPFMIMNILVYMYCYPYSPKCIEMVPYTTTKYFKLLHYSSSALNPCLYVLLNRQWRFAFKKMLCCCSGNRVAGEARSSLGGGW